MIDFRLITPNCCSFIVVYRREQRMLDTLTGLRQFVATDTGVAGGLTIIIVVYSFFRFSYSDYSSWIR